MRGTGYEIVLGVLLLVLLSACGPGAVQQHSRALYVTHDVLAVAASAVQSERDRQQDAAVQSAATAEDARAAVDEVRARWAPVLDAYEALRRAWEVYQLAVIGVQAGDEQITMAALARYSAAVVRAWAALSTATRGVGLEIPQPPEALASLLGVE